MTTFRPLADNVLVVLEPEPTETATGIQMVRLRGPGARYSRTAHVIASGPGYFGRPTFLHPAGLFHANKLQPGDRVIVDALCGNNWEWDVGEAPRQNDNPEVPFLAAPSVAVGRQEYRVIREQEALAVLDEGAVLGEAVRAA